VDLDGTLVATDTLWESLLKICRYHPAALLPVFLAILRGKAHFKSVVACNVSLDADRLPYRPDLLRYLREQKAEGRSLVLVTAAHHTIANAAAAHLSGLFDEVLATNEDRNLHGRVKGQLLTEKFGEGGFTYVGNSASDLAVWRHAASAIPVSARPRVIAGIPTPIEATFLGPRDRLRTLSRAVRMHQWVKNLLVLVPLFTSRDLLNLVALAKLLVVALALSLVASAQYLLNDLIDLDSDREHFEKRHRPLASGDLPIPVGLLLVPCLLFLGGLLGFVVGSWTVLMLLGAYFISCLLYSIVLKTKPLVDVFALAGLYVFRIVIGGFVSNHLVTAWLFSFSFLCFLSLGFLKRCIELARATQADPKRVGRRGYYPADAAILTAMGVAGSFASIVVLALYVYSESANTLYKHPFALWGFVPICLLVQCRWWLSGSRNYIKEDPVRYAISDRVLWVSAAIGAACYWVAIGGI
jgi:4-hydroxybenzoate polyprenyltransferase